MKARRSKANGASGWTPPTVGAEHVCEKGVAVLDVVRPFDKLTTSKFTAGEESGARSQRSKIGMRDMGKNLADQVKNVDIK